MPIKLQVFFALLAGCVLSIPYTYLTGENSWNFFMTVFIGPITTLFLFIVYTYEMRENNHRGGKRPKWGGSYFWILVIYFCSPILLNGASLLLKWTGQEAVSSYIFEYRFLSLLAVPILVVFYNVTSDGVVSIRKRFSGGVTPPPNDVSGQPNP
ncbi:MAG: hypothetical protein AAB488_01920 [Patescibacteria group bacterium]